MKASRRGFFAFLGLGASAAAAKASPVVVIETPKRLNLNRGKPGSVLSSIESAIKDMIKREANAVASGNPIESPKEITKVAWKKVPTADGGFSWVNEDHSDLVEWPKQTIEEKQRQMISDWRKVE